MSSSGLLGRMALTTEVSKETIASIIRETRIVEVGITLVVTSK
jgi:hypothetical protein